MRFKWLMVGCVYFLVLRSFAGDVYYEGTNTFRGYGKVDLNWMVQFLPYNPVILEVGAYQGAETLYAAKIWPHAKVIACEPSPRAFYELKQAIINAQLDNVAIHNCAISDYTGSAVLYCFRSIFDDDFSYEQKNSLLPPFFSPQQNHFHFEMYVPCFCLDEFCAENGIQHVDVLNLNTDGLELQILQASPKILKSVKLIILPSFFYLARMGTPDYFTLKQFLTDAHFLPLAHWYINGECGRAVYISQELYDAYFVRCLGLGLGGLSYP
ncbi:MAG TPA: FkbM family methyltransferase [Rhabdochlamydiaceae bacterium]|jgi:FkbM family methyltransferase